MRATEILRCAQDDSPSRRRAAGDRSLLDFLEPIFILRGQLGQVGRFGRRERLGDKLFELPIASAAQSAPFPVPHHGPRGPLGDFANHSRLGLPVALAARFQQHFAHILEGEGVLGLEPLPQRQPQLVADVDRGDLVPGLVETLRSRMIFQPMVLETWIAIWSAPA